MKTINFSSHFATILKRIARRQPEKIPVVVQKLLVFSADINHPSLKLHKLSGELRGHWL